MLNIIIGKDSNLSRKLNEKFDSTILISSQNIDESLSNIDYKYDRINIIFNQFQKATELDNLDSPVEYINRCIRSTSEVLHFIKKYNKKVNKIIYTSSSSIYGNNTSCSENDNPHPMSLHSSLKLANERLIERFCKDRNINFTNARLFNMYGGEDNFSIISKIMKAYNYGEVLTLINDGEAIRDYIHIDDVVYAYTKILNVDKIPIVNIGTSQGKSILNILYYLQKRGIEIKIKNISKDELKVSISQNSILLNIIGSYRFKQVEEYIYSKVK